MKTVLLNETSLYVSDLTAAERFYEDVIGLEVSRRIEGVQSTLHHDDFTLVLFQASGAVARTARTGRGIGHVSIGICPSEVAPWREQLHRQRIVVEDEIVWPDGTVTMTCRDPDGHVVELKTQLQESHAAVSTQRPAMSNGLSAQWKLFQAASLGLRQPQPHS